MSSISIALCTYNGAEFLREQLESIAAQTIQPSEIVICDDGSSDETENIVRNFARAAPFAVRFYANEKNIGSTKNFEQAITLCHSDLIFLCDQDDVWLPQKIAVIAAEFARQPAVGFVFSDAELVDQNLDSLHKSLWQITFNSAQQAESKAGKTLEMMLKQNVVTGATAAFRADFRASFLPIPTHIPNLIHDYWIALVIAAQAEVSFISEPLIKYRQHAKQQLGIDYKQIRNNIKLPRTEDYTKSIAYHRREVERLKMMCDALAQNSFFKPHQTAIDSTLKKAEDYSLEIIKHYELRRGLPINKFKRIAPIVTETLSGRYHRFSKGYVSSLKDLLADF